MASGMDFKGIAWVGKIQQKFESLCSDVDDLISQETFKYVEDQLQTVGANVTQFCSEFVNDVLPPFSVDSLKVAASEFFSEENKNEDLADKKSSQEDVGKDSAKEICNENSLPHPFIVGPDEGVVVDSSLKKNASVWMYENSVVGVKGSPTEEKPFLSEIPKHEEGSDDRVNMSTPISVEERNSSSMEGQNSDSVNSSTGISDSLQTSDSVISDSGFTSPCDALSTVSSDTDAVCVTETMNESFVVGFELGDESTKSEDFISLIGSASWDDSGSKEKIDDHVSKPGKGTIERHKEWKLGESCIVVDSSELCSISLKPPQRQSYKKKMGQAFVPRLKSKKEPKVEQQATCYEDLNAGPTEPRRESFGPSGSLRLEPASHDFCESEWEII